MNNERKVLAAAIKSREAYEIVKRNLSGDSGRNTGEVFTEQGNVIWGQIDVFYTRDRAATSVSDVGVLDAMVLRSLSSEKHRQGFSGLVQEITRTDVSAPNVAADFLAVRREAAGSKLASAILTNKNEGEVLPLLEDYKLVCTNLENDIGRTREVLKGAPLAAITETYAEGQLIQLWPKALNERLDGGLLRGHHVVVFARPEMGKTLFLVNAVAGFLAQSLTVLYVGNEDPISDIVLRVVCRLTKRNKFDVLSNPSVCESDARKLGYDNLVLAGLAPGTPREIEGLVEEYKPDVVLIDQLRNLSGVVAGKEGNRTNQLESAATAARNLAKKHNVLVVSVTQAGDSASGKAVLDMGDVDGSNTGIPAQADVMVGIGASQDDEASGRRIISLPKNKRSGKHDFFPVKIDPSMSRMWTD